MTNKYTIINLVLSLHKEFCFSPRPHHRIVILGYIMLNNKLLDINRDGKKLVTRLLNPEISNINAFLHLVINSLRNL